MGILWQVHRSHALCLPCLTSSTEFQNRNGLNGGAKALMVIVAVLNAGRNAFSFFLLLIVCMGYGVVKHSLGRTMIYVRVLAIAHFIFAVVYSVASLSITPESAGPLVLLIVLPLAGTLTAFYVWTLNSLNATMKDLIDRKQKTKAMMYKKLWWCILGSIIVIFGFFFINSFAFAGRSDASFVPEHWKARWFVLDGWLNLVYLFDIGFVAYLWRPTANNRRFAMSDEVRIPSFKSQMTNANHDDSLLKMTMDLRSDHSAVGWMRRMHMMPRLTTLAARLPKAVVTCPRCLLSLSLQPHDSVNLLRRKRYSQWAKKTARDGRRMTSHLATRTRENDSPAKTKIRSYLEHWRVLTLLDAGSLVPLDLICFEGATHLDSGCKHVMALFIFHAGVRKSCSPGFSCIVD